MNQDLGLEIYTLSEEVRKLDKLLDRLLRDITEVTFCHNCGQLLRIEAAGRTKAFEVVLQFYCYDCGITHEIIITPERTVRRYIK